MEIIFCGPAVPAQDGGVSYRIKVDGQTLSCLISMEALQDIDPSTHQSNPMAQFELHKDRLLEIAENKIRCGQIQGNKVLVFTRDL